MEADPRSFTQDLAKLEREWKAVLAERKAARRARKAAAAGAGKPEGSGEDAGGVKPAALPPDENAARALALCRRLLAKMSAEARGEAAGGQEGSPGVSAL